MYAFTGCNGLVSITIGSGVKSIEYYAFAKCNKLETLTCLAENVPNTSSGAFDNSMTEYSTLVVPESALQAYKTTYPWSGFGTILPITSNGIESNATGWSTTVEAVYDLEGKRNNNMSRGVNILRMSAMVLQERC